MILPSNHGKKGVLFLLSQLLLPIPLWKDPSTELVHVKSGQQKGDRIDWQKEKVRGGKYKSCEDRVTGCEKKVNGQGRPTPEQPGASEDEDSYLNDHLAGGPSCFKWHCREIMQCFSPNYI